MQQEVVARNYQTHLDLETLKKQVAALTELLSLADQVDKLKRRVDDLESAEDSRQLQILRS